MFPYLSSSLQYIGISYLPWKTLVFSFLLLKVLVLYSLLGWLCVFSPCFSGRRECFPLSPPVDVDVLLTPLDHVCVLLSSLEDLGISSLLWKTLVFSFLLRKACVFSSLLGWAWVFFYLFSGSRGCSPLSYEGRECFPSSLEDLGISSLLWTTLVFSILLSLLWHTWFFSSLSSGRRGRSLLFS